MKILAGTLRGHPFQQPPMRTVRPLSDKVRAAIFDVVGSVDQSIILDAYAGSGAAGFEAISRGAAMVVAVEASPRVARVIEANALSLGIDWGYSLRTKTVASWLADPTNLPRSAYDLIIADPPYAEIEVDVLERLGAYLKTNGIFVVSHASKLPSPALDGLIITKQKLYGDTALTFYNPSL
jgi:16S rRNA (guanine966-N2)-methyltransferase